MEERIKLKKVSKNQFLIEKNPELGMKVDIKIFINEDMEESLHKDQSIKQLVNISRTKGVLNPVVGMPDIHEGYAFPIGAVAAFSKSDGIISPGGVGFDINCGVRVLRTNFIKDEIEPHLDRLLNETFKNIPAGVGSEGLLRVSKSELATLVSLGLKWAKKEGYATEDDIERTEENGYMEGANPDKVSSKAFDRGKTEIGSLGSGNHFLEFDYIDRIFDKNLASKIGLEEKQVVVWIHSGSRGFGHQIATDYAKSLKPVMEKFSLPLFERDFVVAPINSPEGEDYFSAMKAAVNYAFLNRQLITYWIRESFKNVFKEDWQNFDLSLIYDVAHNIAKFEEYEINGKKEMVLLHRKGATRALPKGHPLVPKIYKDIGQIALLPGDMGRASYIVIGEDKVLKETFGSVAHGAGRAMSRSQAIKTLNKKTLLEELSEKNIRILTKERDTILEEAPQAYKDIEVVVKALQDEGLIRPIVRTKPMGVIKG